MSSPDFLQLIGTLLNLSHPFTCTRDVEAWLLRLHADAMRTADMEAERAQLVDKVAKLQAFKDFVHKTLTTMGIPEDPPGKHQAAGCRIGQRLAWIQTYIIDLGNAELATQTDRAARAVDDLRAVERDMAQFRERAIAADGRATEANRLRVLAVAERDQLRDLLHQQKVEEAAKPFPAGSGERLLAQLTAQLSAIESWCLAKLGLPGWKHLTHHKSPEGFHANVDLRELAQLLGGVAAAAIIAPAQVPTPAPTPEEIATNASNHAYQLEQLREKERLGQANVLPDLDAGAKSGAVKGPSA